MFRKPAWAHDARTGPVRYFQNLAVFACEGLLCVIDHRPQYEGECLIVLPSDMRSRIKALAAPYRGKTKAEMPVWQRQHYDEIIQGCAAVEECIREAKEMGDPSDPRVQAWWAKHRRNSTVSLSAGTNLAGYPDLPPLPLGKFTGRTAESDVLIHRPPRRKSRSNILQQL